MVEKNERGIVGLEVRMNLNYPYVRVELIDVKESMLGLTLYSTFKSSSNIN